METTTDTNSEMNREAASGTIPVIAENLVIDTIKTVTGRVTISKRVESTQVDIPLPTINTRYVEHRVPINRVIDERPAVRTEGDTTIISVVREEAVVLKRLVLVEEIHLTREVTRSENTETITLEKDVISIDRKSV